MRKSRKVRAKVEPKASQDATVIRLTWRLRSDNASSLPAATCIARPTLSTPPLSGYTKGALYHKFAGAALTSWVRDDLGPFTRTTGISMDLGLSLSLGLSMSLRVHSRAGRMSRDIGARAVTVHGRDRVVWRVRFKAFGVKGVTSAYRLDPWEMFRPTFSAKKGQWEGHGLTDGTKS